MVALSSLWSMLFGWLPVIVQVVFGCFILILAIMLVLRIIALVLDAIPFL